MFFYRDVSRSFLPGFNLSPSLDHGRALLLRGFLDGVSILIELGLGLHFGLGLGLQFRFRCRFRSGFRSGLAGERKHPEQPKRLRRRRRRRRRRVVDPLPPALTRRLA
jgi:hypothetical protein